MSALRLHECSKTRTRHEAGRDLGRTKDTGRSARSRAGAVGLLVLASLALAGACLAHYVAGANAHRARERTTAGDEVKPGSRSHEPEDAVQVADTSDWLESLRTGAYWTEKQGETRSTTPAARPARRRRDRSEPVRPKRASAPLPTDPGRRPVGGGGTYRTMCVRLCDGFYWPISFATSRSGLESDSGLCARSCNAPVLLHYYSNPGGEPEDMVDLEGRPYAALTKAFAYRTTYNASCKCRPHPWESEARERHQGYAEGSPSVAASATQ